MQLAGKEAHVLQHLHRVYTSRWQGSAYAPASDMVLKSVLAQELPVDRMTP